MSNSSGVILDRDNPGHWSVSREKVREDPELDSIYDVLSKSDPFTSADAYVISNSFIFLSEEMLAAFLPRFIEFLISGMDRDGEVEERLAELFDIYQVHGTYGDRRRWDSVLGKLSDKEIYSMKMTVLEYLE